MKQIETCAAAAFEVCQRFRQSARGTTLKRWEDLNDEQKEMYIETAQNALKEDPDYEDDVTAETMLFHFTCVDMWEALQNPDNL